MILKIFLNQRFHSLNQLFLNYSDFQFHKKFQIENHSCHSSPKKESNKNLCFECDCYLTQLLYNEISSTLELYKPLIWYLYWILFVVLIAVMIYKKTWSNITSYAFVFTLLFVPTLIMNPLIRLILSKIKNEKLDGITVAFTAFVLLLLSLLFFTNRFALNNLKGGSSPTPKTPTPSLSPTPTPSLSPTPKTLKTQSPTPKTQSPTPKNI